MDFSNFPELISSVGFPIAMCIALIWFLVKSSENHKAEMTALTEVINSLKDTIVENTTMLKTIINKLDI